MQREIVTITARFKELAKRSLFTTFDRKLAEFNSMIDTPSKYSVVSHKDEWDFCRYGSKTMYVNFAFEVRGGHSWGCHLEGDDEALELDNDCECYKKAILCITLVRGTTKLELGTKRLFDPTYASVIEVIDAWDTFTICACGCVASYDGWCNDCYVNRYIRTEDQGGICCICHENEGSWCRLSCGHEVHRHCYRDIKDEPVEKGTRWGDIPKKCPLCRALTTIGQCDRNPYSE
jgi:hypothetical protein